MRRKNHQLGPPPRVRSTDLRSTWQLAAITLLVLAAGAPLVAAATPTTTIELTPEFALKEPGTRLSQRKAITLRAKGLDSAIRYVEADVKANGLSQGVKGATVEGGIWTVSVGPFIANSTVEITFRAVRPISDTTTAQVRDAIKQQVKEKVMAAVFDEDRAWEPEDYRELVQASVVEGVDKVAEARSLRAAEGAALSDAINELLQRDDVRVVLEAYVDAAENLEGSSLEASFDYLRDLKAATGDAAYDAWKGGSPPPDAAVLSFWSAIERYIPPAEGTAPTVDSLRASLQNRRARDRFGREGDLGCQVLRCDLYPRLSRGVGSLAGSDVGVIVRGGRDSPSSAQTLATSLAVAATSRGDVGGRRRRAMGSGLPAADVA